MARVLVAYASKYGSVEEVARFVGGVLRDEGADCDVVATREAPHLNGYDLVVLGTGLYMARLHRDAGRFVRRHRDELARVPFAVFAMGPLSADPVEKETVRAQLEHGLERYPELAPVATEIFGGVIVPEKMPFPFNRMPAGDHRDWDEIRRFAASLPVAAPVGV
ncbi:MAG: flavodoxin domain-containing protein [Gaiellaceae bacterium]